MAAFWLYPLAVIELGPRILHHTIRTLTSRKEKRPT
jgi:hypothetical protein